MDSRPEITADPFFEGLMGARREKDRYVAEN
jgi:hypothetical protein